MTMENVKDFLWAAPRMIEEHSRTVAVDVGALVAAVIRSWYPDVELSFVKNGYYSKTTDKEGHHLIADSLEVVEQLMSKLDVHPQHAPIAHASGSTTGEEDLDLDLLDFNDLEDPLS